MAASVALRIDLPVTGLASPMTFAEGVREHQDEVYGVALRITGDRDAALDVASSTFLKAYRAFDRYDQVRPLRHWLLRIATNEAITYVRKRGRELRRRVDVEQASAIADPTETPDAESVAREDRARIRAAVSVLPELYVVPDGVEARISTTGGLLSLRSDNTRLGSGGGIGGCIACGTSVETSGYGAARDRVSVTISAGASSIVVR